MPNRQRTWLLSAAAMLFVVGLVLVFSGNAAGWVFFIIGLTYIGASTQTGQTWAASSAGLARLGLIKVPTLIALLAIADGAAILLK